MAGRRAGAAGRSSSRQRVVNQPSASVTEPGVCSKELQRGESFLLMKETSVLIESGSSPAARDRPRQLIHISCFAPLQQDKGQCKRWGSIGRTPRPWGEARGEENQRLTYTWAGAGLWEGGWTRQQVRDVPGKLKSALTSFQVLASEGQQSK